MDGVLAVLSVVGLFLLRIGVPVLLLVALGILIDRWQTRREQYIEQRYATQPAEVEAGAEAEEVVEEAKKGAGWRRGESCQRSARRVNNLPLRPHPWPLSSRVREGKRRWAIHAWPLQHQSSRIEPHPQIGQVWPLS
jgi:hypothetical protein